MARDIARGMVLAVAVVSTAMTGCGATAAAVDARVQATLTAREYQSAQRQPVAPAAPAATPAPVPVQLVPQPQPGVAQPGSRVIETTADSIRPNERQVSCPPPIYSGKGQRWTNSVTVPQGCVAVIDAFELNGTRGIVTTLPTGTHAVNMLDGKLVQVPTGDACDAFQRALDAYRAGAGTAPSRADRPNGC